MEKKKLWGAESILAVAVSGFLAVLFLLNAHLIWEPAGRFLRRETDFQTFVSELQTSYTENTAWKDPFVNLSGLFARLTGQRMCNETIRLNNGMLCYPSDEQYVYWVGENLVSFCRFLDGKGIPFLYMQAPCKSDTDATLMPVGVEHYANRDADDFLAYLTQNGVNAFDLRPFFSKTAQQVEETFFRTDHHWTPEAALRACPLILEQMDALLPGQTLDTANAAFDQWEAHTLEDWFLGSLGKRTGVYYGGVDDITYYTPRFETHMSRNVLKHMDFFTGDFVQANMCMEYAQRRDYFKDSPYCIYVGGDYPLVQHRNASAPNELRVLMIKDSFSLPLQCYFSTIFTEVDVIDPRYLENMTVAEYVSLSEPDMVVMMINPIGGLGSQEYAYYGTELEQARQSALTGTRTVLAQGDVVIPMSEDGYASKALDAALEPGKRYTFCCDGVEFPPGSATSDGVMAALYNWDTDCFVTGSFLDVDFVNQTGGFTWRFDVPEQEEGQLQLLLYAGVPGQTQGIELTYRNASLTLEE